MTGRARQAEADARAENDHVRADAARERDAAAAACTAQLHAIQGPGRHLARPRRARRAATRPRTRPPAVLAGDLDPEQITEGEFARRLPLPDLPDVDLLWRTGAEQRTSNFLPWHSTYAELFFTTSLWPDVDRRDLWDAVAEYARRRRRYGAATG